MTHAIKWATEGADIAPDKIGSLLYTNSLVKEFLENDNKKIISAGKGVGKTLLLTKKRFELEKRYQGGGILFIPASAPFLDFVPEQLSNISKNDIAFIQSGGRPKLFWQFSIIISILSYKPAENSMKEDCEQLPKWIFQLIFSNVSSNPSDVFHKLINSNTNSSKILNDIQNNFGYLTRLFIKYISRGVFVFIDRLDQAMRDLPRDFWINIQIGLLEAAWDICRKNNHVKVFCSIREEAYSNYSSEDRNAINGSVVQIKYSFDDLKNMINKSSEFYENGKIFSELIGKSRFKNPKTRVFEQIEDYIIRHTVCRPRDFNAIIGKLKREGKFDTETFRKKVNEIASNEIARNLFYENERFLNCLGVKEERENFLAMIPHNVLSRELLLNVCSKFNNMRDCGKCGCKLTQQCKHPFSDLFNMGLLGYIDRDDVNKQKFQRPGNIKISEKNTLPENTSYYLIHPCLNDYIKDLRPQINNEGKSFIIPFITIKDAAVWKQNEVNIFELFSNLEAKYDRKERDEVFNSLKFLNIKERNKKIKEYLEKYIDKNNPKYKSEKTITNIDTNSENKATDIKTNNKNRNTGEELTKIYDTTMKSSRQKKSQN